VKNVTEPDRPQMTIQNGAEKMRFAYQNNVDKNTDTLSEY
jgi:hypothetical protein